MIPLNYFRETIKIAEAIDVLVVDHMIERLRQLKQAQGRLFILGVGGSAANASHAASDFRKLCNIEAYAPTDNVAELTARTNDDGWETVFTGWLDAAKANDEDVLLVLSVGGGSYATSRNILKAVGQANLRGLSVLGIVGPEGGYTAQHGDIVLKVPCSTSHYITQRGGGTPATPMEPRYITAFTEAFQMVVLHCIVNDERLR